MAGILPTLQLKIVKGHFEQKSGGTFSFLRFFVWRVLDLPGKEKVIQQSGR
jgi:hypothetical protein